MTQYWISRWVGGHKRQHLDKYWIYIRKSFIFFTFIYYHFQVVLQVNLHITSFRLLYFPTLPVAAKMALSMPSRLQIRQWMSFHNKSWWYWNVTCIPGLSVVILSWTSPYYFGILWTAANMDIHSKATIFGSVLAVAGKILIYLDWLLILSATEIHLEIRVGWPKCFLMVILIYKWHIFVSSNADCDNLAL